MKVTIEKGSLDLNHPDYYNNREVSWLDFNYRVLQEACDDQNPLLEQLKFIAIGSANLDEFFMVRVAGLKDQVKMGFNKPENKAQLTPQQQLKAIEQKNRQNVAFQYQRFNTLVETLKTYDVYLCKPDVLNEDMRKQLEQIFLNDILPTLTPLGIDA
ncbi:RNA degradosome polyphosphate kinase, partial [Staphylococcus pseudintermedius]